MKFLLLALPFLLATNARADSRALSFTCDARELKMGDAGRTGTFALLASTKNDVVNGPWEISATFLGNSILDSGTICGRDILAKYKCGAYSPSRKVEERGGVPLAFSLRSVCNDPDEVRVPPRQTVEARFVLDSTRTHGRYSCGSNDGKSDSAIELTNCR